MSSIFSRSTKKPETNITEFESGQKVRVKSGLVPSVGPSSQSHDPVRTPPRARTNLPADIDHVIVDLNDSPETMSTATSSVVNGATTRTTSPRDAAHSSGGGGRSPVRSSRTSASSSAQPGVGVGADCHFNRAYEHSRLRTRLEVIESIRGDLEAEAVEVPGVIVVGNQSAGKSSVLEAISGINFPRGENTCTRCASIVRLESGNLEANERAYALLSVNDPEQKQCDKIRDFSAIGVQIEKLTKKLGEGQDGGTILADDVIYITVRNRTGPTMTLIDLPGLTFVHKTQKNIHDVTVELIRRYIKNEQAVILAVIPATEDFGNCEALNLAADVDPDGERTLGVATKCDMIGNDSDLCAKLRMERTSDIKLKLGFVGVRCRGPGEVRDGISFQEMAKRERELFNSHPALTGKGLKKEHWGMDTLVEKICNIQEQTVERWLPKVKLQVAQMIQAKERELDASPLPCPDFSSKRKKLLEIIYEIDRKWYDLSQALAFREADPSMNISARVRGIFARMRNSVRKGIPKFLDAGSQKEIGKLLRECKAHGLPNFVSDSVFTHMSRHQIMPHLQQNAKHLIQEVSTYMTIVAGVLAAESSKEYPKLGTEFEIIAATVVQKQTEKARTHILELCEAEHLVFVSEEDRYLDILNEISQTVKSVAPLLAQSTAHPSIANAAVQQAKMNQGQATASSGSNINLSNGAPLSAAVAAGNAQHDVLKLCEAQARNLQRYGITGEHLLRLCGGADGAASGDLDNNAGPGGAGGGANLGLSQHIGSSRELNLEKVKETQVSLIAYSHIIQGRFVDSACMLCYKFLVKDLQQAIQHAFHDMSLDQDRLEICMASDPEVVAKRKVVEESLQRLNNSMHQLSKCD
ncbi:unnamed protein product [Amoebophrya sp. A25]|nr:unnamed protein product [Amoebophrya sp. A25]|eukprot:GSA25T00023796001.1